MIGAIIGAAGSIGATLLGQYFAGKQQDKALEAQEKARQEQKAWYERKANENPLSRSDVRALLSAQQELYKSRNKDIEATAAVMGRSDASVNAERAANAQAMAQATRDIAAGQQARTDQAAEQAMQAQMGIYNSTADIYNQRSANVANAGAALGQTFGTLGAGISDYMDTKNTQNNNTDKQKV